MPTENGGQALGASPLDSYSKAWLRNMAANYVIATRNRTKTAKCLSHGPRLRVSSQDVARSATLHGVQGGRKFESCRPDQLTDLAGVVSY